MIAVNVNRRWFLRTAAVGTVGGFGGCGAVTGKIGLVVQVFNHRAESEVVDVTVSDRDDHAILESRHTVQPADQTPFRGSDRISVSNAVDPSGNYELTIVVRGGETGRWSVCVSPDGDGKDAWAVRLRPTGAFETQFEEC